MIQILGMYAEVSVWWKMIWVHTWYVSAATRTWMVKCLRLWRLVTDLFGCSKSMLKVPMISHGRLHLSIFVFIELLSLKCWMWTLAIFFLITGGFILNYSYPNLIKLYKIISKHYYYTPSIRANDLGGGGLSVCLSPVCGHDSVHACHKKWVYGFFWKFVHSLPSVNVHLEFHFILIG